MKNHENINAQLTVKILSFKPGGKFHSYMKTLAVLESRNNMIFIIKLHLHSQWFLGLKIWLKKINCQLK